MRHSSLLPLLLALVSSSAVDGARSFPEDDDDYCNGHCLINLGNFNCSVALQKYEFSGSCCSLQNAPTGTGYCQLLVTSGFCDYATKGYAKCMDDLEDPSTQDFDEDICGSMRTVFGTSHIECPASRFAIPDPYLEQEEKDDSNVISIDTVLKFQFDHGKGRPPSDKEINVILEEARVFLADYLQEQALDASTGLFNYDGLTWFDLENIRQHYDYAGTEASVSFSLVFHATNLRVFSNNDEELDQVKEMLQNLVLQADVPGHISQQIPEMEAIDHSYNVFHATQSIVYRASLA
jgi:hypothetical protein